MGDHSISVIYPPPELRNIVDKTASFVARNGPEFETRIQQNEPNNPKFNFLKPGDPYNAYYQFKVKELRENGTNGSSSVPANSAANQTASATPIQKATKQLENFMEIPIITRDPPPAFEFSDDPPSISAFDLDIVKLTAQFVAIHGRSFLTNLMNREQRNYQFDFLRPQHGLFTYFTQLIEQYSKILMPSKTFLAQLEKEVVDSKLILEKVRYRTEWTKIVEAEKRKEEEEAERERIQYAQIDWHDFVIVETVDYQPTETGQFPPPTTPEQVGSRLLLQQRIESNGAEAVEMDVESDEEKAEEPEAEKTKETSLPPLPPSLDNVLIRKDYNPKAAKVVAAQPSAASRPDSYFISPMTGEKIPAEKLQDHMRFSLLDPRWVEQRDRTIQEKTQQEEVYAQGSAIEDSLKHLAERRTDIFGSGDAETSIGRKIGEEEKKPEKVTWDGHTNSVEATTRAARANITIEEQIHQIHKTHGLLPENDKDKIGPTVQSSSGGHQQNQPPKLHNPPPPLMNTAMPMRPQMMPPILPSPHHQPDPYMIPGNMGLHMYNVPMAPPPLDPMMQMRLPPAAPDQLEPAYKKARTEDSFIPESEFLQNNPPNVSVKIQVPHSSEKSEWRLNGQVINLTLPYTDVFSVVKAKIHELTNMPPGKQKLQYEGIFVKDSNSLAFYNIPSGASIILGLKERGGRKK
ncbi:PREDICTED: splicing factor 3A subunit 1-like [Rhagoletis zephyria]|uniref:splicing factor 3A subunit 1-like n=1 Tax=Rhagoletis zephyria TaxID=28612 RepID=UPI0008118B30|nr:PREDICTED: splicing factor 3A subunit 1-like [Rhagoletis zephyria]